MGTLWKWMPEHTALEEKFLGPGVPPPPCCPRTTIYVKKCPRPSLSNLIDGCFFISIWMPCEIIARYLCVPCKSKTNRIRKDRTHEHHETSEHYFRTRPSCGTANVFKFIADLGSKRFYLRLVLVLHSGQRTARIHTTHKQGLGAPRMHSTTRELHNLLFETWFSRARVWLYHIPLKQTTTFGHIEITN